MRMDAAHRDAILYVANEIASDQFQDQKLGEFFGELTAMATMMRVLAAAVMYGNGEFQLQEEVKGDLSRLTHHLLSNSCSSGNPSPLSR